MNTPLFILRYLDYLRQIFSSNPDILYTKYNLPITGTGSSPIIHFSEFFQTNQGWGVIHQDAVSGKQYLVEIIEPVGIGGSVVSIPPIVMDLNTPLVKPSIAPPSGRFILMIDNKGLPVGYSSNTRVDVFNINDNVKISSFYVPFREIYELPISFNGNLLEYRITIDKSINSISGIYDPIVMINPIRPTSGNLYNVSILWELRKSSEVAIRKVIIIVPEQLPDAIPVSTITGSVVNGVLQPIKILPSTNKSSLPFPMLPALYELTSERIDPDGTYRATSVDQMFSFTPSNFQKHVIKYNVGINPKDFINPVWYKIRNNTVTNDLAFRINIPNFLISNAPSEFTLGPQQEQAFAFSFDERDARSKSETTRERKFIDQIVWNVNPLNITGPVLVRRNMPLLQFNTPDRPLPPQPSPVQENISETKITSAQVQSLGINTIYIGLDPSDILIAPIDTAIVKLIVFVGGSGISPSSNDKIVLEFDRGSIKWETLSPTIVDITTDGTSISTVRGLIRGVAEIKATIEKSPINMTHDAWDLLKNSMTDISGIGTREGLNLVVFGRVLVDSVAI